MRTAGVILMLLTLVACGKKEAGESGPAPAPEEKAQEEKLSEMAADRPTSTIVPPATGEGMSDDPADTRDATPTEPGAVPVPGDKQDPGPATPGDEIKTVAPGPGISSMASGGKGGGGPGSGSGGGPGAGVGGEDLDDSLKSKLKRQPKPVTKATGFHDKEQDEPTQE